MTNKQKNTLQRILVGGFIFLLATFLPIKHPMLQMLVYLLAYAIAGSDIIPKAFRNIGHGQFLDENFLMMIATSGAFIINEFAEGVVVMLFYQIGELFQSIAVNRSRKSITALMDIRPDTATRMEGNKTKIVSQKKSTLVISFLSSLENESLWMESSYPAIPSLIRLH